MKPKQKHIYRIPTHESPRYIRALEIVPGLLIHPDLSYMNRDEGIDIDEQYCCWSITHKDSGFLIASGILERAFAIKAARKLNRTAKADCEWNGLLLLPEWIQLAKLIRSTLPLSEEWPKELEVNHEH